LPAVQVTPPLIERRWPSSPQTSTSPFPCATTSQTFVASVSGVGSTNVQVAPPLVLRASPHDVPTNTFCELSGSIAMPNAENSVRSAVVLQKPAGGVVL